LLDSLKTTLFLNDALTMNNHSALQCFNRPALKKHLEHGEYDLAVIGGGITGAGIARDAAMRGLKVALLEAQDFASGTSSRSSKMIHGGLRYLLSGELGVMKESVAERAAVHNIAPHLAEKCHFIVTARSWAESIKLRIALSIYEYFGRVAKRDQHVIWSADELQRREPHLNTDGVYCALVYTEYLTDDARLTLATLRSAKDAGAVIANYYRVVNIAKQGELTTLHATSQLPEDDSQITLKAKVVVNAAGPWVDHLCQQENPLQAPRLALSRGIHVVIPRDKLPVNHTVVMYAPDKRTIFAVPRGDTTYLGTTDEFYSKHEYWPAVYQRDVDYLLQTCRHYFPCNPLSNKDVVAVWSGVRPLVGNTDKKATEISRKDEIWEGPLGMLSIAGGKLSAYRAMAERVVDKVIALGAFDAAPCKTATTPLPGGLKTSNTQDKDVPARLTQRYGFEAATLYDMGAELEAEVSFAVLVEGAVRLEDYWVRRSRRAWFDLDAGMASLAPAASIMAQLLGWSKARQQQEIDHCLDIHRTSLQHLQTQ
jgi:glycerol-3-phosphate dehydrogenase